MGVKKSIVVVVVVSLGTLLLTVTIDAARFYSSQPQSCQEENCRDYDLRTDTVQSAFGSGATSEEIQTLELINVERGRHRLPPLAWASQIHSDSRRSASIQNRRRTVGHPIGGPEISASGNSPEHVVQMWMNSSGHRRMILTQSYTGAAVGKDGRYWSTRFVSGERSERVVGSAWESVRTIPASYSPQVKEQPQQAKRKRPVRSALRSLFRRR